MADVSAIEKELVEIKAGLQALKGKIKNADELVQYQERLAKIDSMRVDGKFKDAKGEIPAGQAKLHDM